MLTFSIIFCLLNRVSFNAGKMSKSYLARQSNFCLAPELFKRCGAPLSSFWLQLRGPGFKNSVILGLLASFLIFLFNSTDLLT